VAATTRRAHRGTLLSWPSETQRIRLLGYWLQLKPEFDLACSYTAAFTRWEQHGSDDLLSYVANQLAVFSIPLRAFPQPSL
jgi:hypothetical protein